MPARSRHPLLNPRNGITFRFLPGVVLGALLHAWFAALQPKSVAKSSAPKKRKAGSAHAAQEGATAAFAAESSSEDLKMVLCVNSELKMGKGKIAAQCSHAAVGVVQSYQKKHATWFRQWETAGQTKIALKIDSTAALMALAQRAADGELPYYVVADAGRTQIAAGSKTVVAIGPAPKSRVDALTSHLSLL